MMKIFSNAVHPGIAHIASFSAREGSLFNKTKPAPKSVAELHDDRISQEKEEKKRILANREKRDSQRKVEQEELRLYLNANKDQISLHNPSNQLSKIDKVYAFKGERFFMKSTHTAEKPFQMEKRVSGLHLPEQNIRASSYYDKGRETFVEMLKREDGLLKFYKRTLLHVGNDPNNSEPPKKQPVVELVLRKSKYNAALYDKFNALMFTPKGIYVRERGLKHNSSPQNWKWITFDNVLANGGGTLFWGVGLTETKKPSRLWAPFKHLTQSKFNADDSYNSSHSSSKPGFYWYPKGTKPGHELHVLSRVDVPESFAAAVTEVSASSAHPINWFTKPWFELMQLGDIPSIHESQSTPAEQSIAFQQSDPFTVIDNRVNTAKNNGSSQSTPAKQSIAFQQSDPFTVIDNRVNTAKNNAFHLQEEKPFWESIWATAKENRSVLAGVGLASIGLGGVTYMLTKQNKPKPVLAPLITYPVANTLSVSKR
jgi:hypothetical protein